MAQRCGRDAPLGTQASEVTRGLLTRGLMGVPPPPLLVTLGEAALSKVLRVLLLLDTGEFLESWGLGADCTRGVGRLGESKHS